MPLTRQRCHERTMHSRYGQPIAAMLGRIAANGIPDCWFVSSLLSVDAETKRAIVESSEVRPRRFYWMRPHVQPMAHTSYAARKPRCFPLMHATILDDLPACSSCQAEARVRAKRRFERAPVRSAAASSARLTSGIAWSHLNSVFSQHIYCLQSPSGTSLLLPRGTDLSPRHHLCHCMHTR